MRRICHALATVWELTQVELRGRHSAQRVLDLTQYTNETSWLRVVGVLVVTPVPCVLVTVLVDILPLADPSKGIEANGAFFLRMYYTYFVVILLATQQNRMSVPLLPYPSWRLIVSTMLTSALSVGCSYLLSLQIGFPLPFIVLTTSPAWVTLLVATLAFEWGWRVRKTPGAASMIVNAIKLWLCDFLLGFIYPPYFYVFTTLSETAQMGFALLLPVIKVAMRNLFARTITHLSDEMPEAVVFNCDVFNALFVAYCMQNSPTLWTTLEIMAVDIVMIAASLRDAEPVKRKLKSLEDQTERTLDLNTHVDLLGAKVLGDRALSTLDRASILLRLIRQKEKSYIIHKSRPLKLEREPSTRSLASVHPVGQGPPQLPVTVRYTQMVRRLLYMSEFVLLLNYVEVTIPLVFSIYLLVMDYLPNRDYYAQLHGLSERELVETLSNVLFYCSLQLVSLLLLLYALTKKFGLSPLHQLAFVLDKQFVGVQVKLVFWVFYSVQASLQHSGYDYTFQFSWLRGQDNVTSS